MQLKFNQSRCHEILIFFGEKNIFFKSFKEEGVRKGEMKTN